MVEAARLETTGAVDSNPHPIYVAGDDIHDYLREQAETIRHQHNNSQAGDTTYSWEVATRLAFTPQFTLGSLGRFSHPTYGIIKARYVEIAGVASDLSDLEHGGPFAVQLRASGDPVGWRVTNRPSEMHDDWILGLPCWYDTPDSGMYGWLAVEGNNLRAVAGPPTTPLEAGMTLGWDGSHGLAPDGWVCLAGLLRPASPGVIGAGSLMLRGGGINPSQVQRLYELTEDLTGRLANAEQSIIDSASGISNLAQRVTDAEGSIESVRVTFTRRVDEVSARYGQLTRELTAKLESESETRTTETSALARMFTNLSSEVVTKSALPAELATWHNVVTMAAIQSESKTLSTAYDSLATQVVSLASKTLTDIAGVITYTDAKILTEQTARTNADTALASRLTSIEANVGRAAERIEFIDTFSTYNSLAEFQAAWEYTTQAPAPIFASDPTVAGGKVLAVGNATSPSTTNLYPRVRIPYDPSALYCIEVRFALGTPAAGLAAGLTHIGVQGFNLAGENVVAAGLHNWVGCVNRVFAPGGYNVVVGYFRGRGLPAGVVPPATPNPDSPIHIANTIVTMRPVLWFRESGGHGVVLIDSVKLYRMNQYPAVNAKITSVQTALASVDSAMATRISTIEANYISTTSATALINSEATARANADSALATNISTLSTTVGNHTTSLTTIQSSINGLNGKYGVEINSNGHITGFQMLGTATRGDFIIRADRFAVVDPADALAVDPVFEVVGGITRIKRAVIGESNITATQLAPNSATKLVTKELLTGVFQPLTEAVWHNVVIGTANTELLVVNDDTSPGTVVIRWDFMVEQNGSNPDRLSMRLTRQDQPSGTVVGMSVKPTMRIATSTGEGTMPVSLAWHDAIPAGTTRIYRLQARGDDDRSFLTQLFGSAVFYRKTV